MAMYLGGGQCPLIMACKLKKDLSYGIFLYGWPIGQIINEYMPLISSYIAAFATMIVATIVAYVSDVCINHLLAMMRR